MPPQAGPPVSAAGSPAQRLSRSNRPGPPGRPSPAQSEGSNVGRPGGGGRREWRPGRQESRQGGAHSGQPPPASAACGSRSRTSPRPAPCRPAAARESFVWLCGCGWGRGQHAPLTVAKLSPLQVGLHSQQPVDRRLQPVLWTLPQRVGVPASSEPHDLSLSLSEEAPDVPNFRRCRCRCCCCCDCCCWQRHCQSDGRRQQP